MKDPQRIPEIMAALTRLWEGRPGLTLTQLVGLLETHGAGWNATDPEALDIIRALSTESPISLTDIPGAVTKTSPGERHSAGSHGDNNSSDINGGNNDSAPRSELGLGHPLSGRYLITTESPEQRITVSSDRIAVRRIPLSRNDATHNLPQPVIWEHSGVRTCTVAQPLVILDAEGITHRLGLVSSIRVLAKPGTDKEKLTLNGLRQRSLQGVFLVELEDATLLVDRTLWLFTTGRRELHRERIAWARLLECTIGSPVQIALTGGETRELPTARRITVLE